MFYPHSVYLVGEPVGGRPHSYHHAWRMQLERSNVAGAVIAAGPAQQQYWFHQREA